MPAFVDYPTLERWTAMVEWSAALVHVRAIAWSDDIDRPADGGGGFIPEDMPRIWGPRKEAQLNGLIEKLVTKGLWVPVDGGGFQIVDFDDYSQRRAYLAVMSSQRSGAGKAGGQTTQNRRRQLPLPPDTGPPGSSRSEANGKQNHDVAERRRRPLPPDPHPQAAATGPDSVVAAEKERSVGV